MESYIEFEKPIATLEKKLVDLRELSQSENVDLTQEIQALEAKLEALVEETFSSLNSWQRVQLSRHPNRPYTRDYIENLFPQFKELRGDRCFGDDPAIMAGLAHWPPQAPGHNNAYKGNYSGFPVAVIGHQKGRTTKQKMHRNFGMAKPEGYRKAIRVMDLAERMRIPIITFIDTPGAYPGIETEERGQAQAIAESITKMFSLTVPVISIVIGEGGSGGALAIGIANKVFMLEFSTYSVISPEGCASILWSDATLADKASDVLKMTATDLSKLKVIDGMISEPKGGAHRNWAGTFENVKKKLVKEMEPLFDSLMEKGKKKADRVDLKLNRFDKFRKMGKAALAKSKRGKKND